MLPRVRNQQRFLAPVSPVSSRHVRLSRPFCKDGRQQFYVAAGKPKAQLTVIVGIQTQQKPVFRRCKTYLYLCDSGHLRNSKENMKKTLSPLERYRQDLETTGFVADTEQAKAVQELERIYHACRSSDHKTLV